MLVTKGIGKIRRIYYMLVNKLGYYKKIRWTITLLLIATYIQTVQAVSYDIVTYLIGFYLLQLLIAYFTPRGVTDDIDPHQQSELFTFEENLPLYTDSDQRDGVEMEHAGDKPLVRSLGEMEIWQRATFAFLLGLGCTYFKMIEVDVFWPLLLVYFIILACYTIQKILKTMEKYRYGLGDFQKQPC